ncbi:Hint domain-containing protein [Litoreibacter roseus]|uniref:Hedgehog/Intein (Hint) domain-containing protein n=1 Tax=Litoreibacter roseus TaxID=2601869 RepID=A0A6N6JDH3_9RHOB|nr:Hint domain-containing protein [Litoreibacter roseus]GFE63358.1 hypothetical protein KIN_04320 [Litoreibacter roseus]
MTEPVGARMVHEHFDDYTTDYSTRAASGRGPLPRAQPRARSYDVAWLNRPGCPAWDTVVAPGSTLLENACSSLVRGALINTYDGPVAIEDIVPGTLVDTSDHGLLPVQWIGSYTIDPNDVEDSDPLIRVMTDAFGLAKPSQDLMVTGRAHMRLRHAACTTLFGLRHAFAPVRCFEDGLGVIAIKPVARVTVFNIAFERQATYLANGMELESYHPGTHSEALRDDELRHMLLRLFPNVRGTGDFGQRTIERLTAQEVLRLRSGG